MQRSSGCDVCHWYLRIFNPKVIQSSTFSPQPRGVVPTTGCATNASQDDQDGADGYVSSLAEPKLAVSNLRSSASSAGATIRARDVLLGRVKDSVFEVPQVWETWGVFFFVVDGSMDV